MDELYIKVKSHAELTDFRVEGFPEKFDILDNSPQIFVQHLLDGGKSQIEVLCIHRYDIEENLFNSFNERLGDPINYRNPDNAIIKQFLTVESNTWHKSEDIFNLMRYIYDFNGRPQTSRSWSLDGSNYFPLFDFAMSIDMTDKPKYDHNFLEYAINSNWEEPLAFDIFKEAKKLVDSSPRSALVLLAVALEVGAKTYISKISPITGEFVEKIKTSPPMDIVITKFIPSVNPNLNFNQPTKKMIMGLFQERNSLVHRGSLFGNTRDKFLTKETLSEYTKLVKDLLFYFERELGNSFVTVGIHITSDRVSETPTFGAYMTRRK